MQAIQQPEILSTVISSGVDWITATNQGGDTARCSDEFADHEFSRVLDEGGRVVPESRLGYTGYVANSFFYGHHARGRLLMASGSQAHNLYRSIANLSHNVSRIDLQATVWTHGEQPNLAVQGYHVVKGRAPASQHVRNCTLITSQPSGDTLNVGKRKSDQYGRIYDKATEGQLGTPRTVWRYEVEYKRRPANVALSHLRASECDKALASEVVWRWFERRGIRPIYAPPSPSEILSFSLAKEERDTLRWFRDTVSVTVARMVKEHGREVVLEALGLSVIRTEN